MIGALHETEEVPHRRLRSLVGHLAFLGAWLQCALFPFGALGNRPLTLSGLWFGDFLAALAAPFWLALILDRRRALLRAPLPWGVLAWALTLTASELVHGATPSILVKQFQLCLTILGIAAVIVAGRGPDLLRAVVLGGALSLSIGVVTYLGAALGAERLGAAQATTLLGVSVLRFVGTALRSPEHAGECLVVLLAAALTLRRADPGALRPISTIVAVCGGLALLLTFSYSWVGGLAVALGLLPRTAGAAMRWTGGAFVALCALSLSWLMNFSLPAPPPAGGPVPCSTLDCDHHVTAFWSDRAPPQCRQYDQRRPYPGPLTTYAFAKQGALALIVVHPWLGVGPERYGDELVPLVERRFPESREGARLLYYDSPHCTYLGALVDAGVPGALALGLLLWGLLGKAPPRGAPERFLWLGAIGLLLIGVNIDLLRLRQAWVLLGLLAGYQALRSAGGPARR